VTAAKTYRLGGRQTPGRPPQTAGPADDVTRRHPPDFRAAPVCRRKSRVCRNRGKNGSFLAAGVAARHTSSRQLVRKQRRVQAQHEPDTGPLLSGGEGVWTRPRRSDAVRGTPTRESRGRVGRRRPTGVGSEISPIMPCPYHPIIPGGFADSSRRGIFRSRGRESAVNVCSTSSYSATVPGVPSQ
jgi:hypothetical protein